MFDQTALFLPFVPELRRVAVNRDRHAKIWHQIRQTINEALHYQRLKSEHTTIRGARVAANSLVALCLRNIAVNKWNVFTAPSLANQVARKLDCDSQLVSALQILKIPSLASDRLPHIDLWFDPVGATAVSILLRQWFGKNAYPIVAVQHTMSLHNLLYDYFLPIVSSRTFPWDSLVCSTKASAQSVSNLISTANQACGHTRPQADCMYRGRVDVIPLPVNTDYFSPGNRERCRRVLNLNKDNFVILYVGAVSATKADLVPFLAPLKELTQKGKQEQAIKWIIAGPPDARYKTYLSKQINAMDLENNVVLYDYVSQDDKLNLYRAADVFFSPVDSIQESFGLTPVEAMACGIPQIVSDWDGYRETVEQGITGFRIKTVWARCDGELRTSGFCLGSDHDHIALGQSVFIDLRDWSASVKALLYNPSLRHSMGQASRSRAVDLYSYSAIAAQHQELWSELATLQRKSPIEFVRGQDSLQTARYFDCFSHYASTLMTDNTRLKCANRAELTPTYLDRAVQFMNSETQLIDLKLCRELMADVRAGCTDNRLWYADDEFMATRRMRHLLWLMKHGLVEIEPDEMKDHEEQL